MPIDNFKTKIITRSSTRAISNNNLFEEPSSNKNALRNSIPRSLIPEIGQSDANDEDLISSWARRRI